MLITFTCDCGQTLILDELFVGKVIRCPACARTEKVPVPAGTEPVAEPVLAPAAKPWMKDQGPAKPWEGGRSAEAPAPIEPPKPHDPDNPFGFTSPGEEACRRAREAQEREELDPRATEGGIPIFVRWVSTNRMVAGGITMLVALAWFFTSLMFDKVKLFPMLLFLVGLFTFCNLQKSTGSRRL